MPTALRVMLLGLLAVTACFASSSDEQIARAAPQSKTQPPRPATSSHMQAPAAAPQDFLTADGLGRLRIGMGKAAALSADLVAAPPKGDETEDCQMLVVKHRTDTWAMFNGGVLTRITIDGRSPIRTREGVGLGAPEAQVLAIYKGKAKIEPHPYAAPPAHSLTVWIAGERRGLRFETDGKGIVRVIHAGDRTITYAEGCA